MKEFWIHESGYMIIETERNPCVCCPDTYDKTRARFNNPKMLQTVHIGKYERRRLFRVMKKMGYELLRATK